MKATEILEWICKESINGELLNIVDVPKEGDNEWEQNEEWWMDMFGGCPPEPIAAGKYLYYYRFDYDWVTDKFGNNFVPDAEIEVFNDFIYLYKLEG